MPEIRDFLLIIRWGESGKVILPVSIAVFRVLSKKFSGKDDSAPLPLEKNRPVHLCLGQCNGVAVIRQPVSQLHYSYAVAVSRTSSLPFASFGTLTFPG